ncbi:hypothetical protein MK079_02410 [Candidatus Gracilibacteria bacterium]|nr:hypothetical protein [Candidatus Gracilibacteria bacterium]
MKKTVYLLDGNNFIYRMFFALPEFSTKSGKIVNATFGMAKFFVNSLAGYNPDYVFFVKDAKGKNFRHEIFEDYKATRERMPDNLRVQIADIEDMIDRMGIGKIEREGYEADDLIGTLASKLGQSGDYQVVILSGDKDLYSLVGENVKIYDTMKQRLYGPEETKDKYGIESNMIIDYLAIMGDSADNIPGIAGFGPKKAVTLINSLGSVEDIYKTVDEVENKNIDPRQEFAYDPDLMKLFNGKTYEKLREGRESAFLSKKLATIACDIELSGFDINSYIFESSSLLNDSVQELFEELEFHSLLPEKTVQKNTWKDRSIDVQTITTDADLEKLKQKISEYDTVILDTETTSLDIIDADLVGVSVYLDDKNVYYINRLHEGNHVSDNILQDFLSGLLDADLTLVGHNIKYDLQIIQRFLEGKPVSNILSDDSQMSFGM